LSGLCGLAPIWSFPASRTGAYPLVGQRVLDLVGPITRPTGQVTRLGYYNSFRGKPAITKFGWPFTPTQKSLQSFATLRNETLSGYSPRGLPKGRSLGFGCNRAECGPTILLIHYTKGTQKHGYFLLICNYYIFMLFHSHSRVSFSSVPSQYWFTIVHLLFKRFRGRTPDFSETVPHTSFKHLRGRPGMPGTLSP
jgi:hypothetical protein